MIALTHIEARLQLLNDLLAEIETEGYTTISQIKGVIHCDIESLESLKLKYGELDE